MNGRSARRFRNDLLYAGARLLWILSSVIPRMAGLWLFGQIGMLAFLFPGRERRRTIEHLRYIYGGNWTEETIAKTARDVWKGLGKNLFDALYIPRLDRERFDKLVKHDPLDEFDAAFRRRRGVVVITAHTGCFEMLLHFFAIHGYKSFAVGRRLFDERLERMIRRIRSGENIEYMDRSESPRRIMRLLNDGRAFGVLLDQDTRVEGVFVDFMGKPAYTPCGPVKMAMRMGIPVFVATTARMTGTDTHFVYLSEELQLVNTGDLSADLERNVQIANDRICATIEKHPDQWVWMHRRWRRRKPGAGSAGK